MAGTRFSVAVLASALFSILAVSLLSQNVQETLVQIDDDDDGKSSSDFPYSMQPENSQALYENQIPDSDSNLPFTVKEDGQKLAGLEPKEEPKAKDNPIGLAEAAKILKDSEIFAKSKGSDAMDSWKAAVKNSGPAIIQDVTDDATAYNPFPKSSLSEQMEIKDVWDKARALAKPVASGSLDGDATTAKKAIQNAESQADSAAYLAANEAAVVDSYDVSIPNVDMMARSSSASKTQVGRALARRDPEVSARPLLRQALAQHPHARAQALAELPDARVGSGNSAAVRAAEVDIAEQRRVAREIRGHMDAARGREQEAARLADYLSAALRKARTEGPAGNAALDALRGARDTAEADDAAHKQRLAELQSGLSAALARRQEAQRLVALLDRGRPSNSPSRQPPSDQHRLHRMVQKVREAQQAVVSRSSPGSSVAKHAAARPGPGEIHSWTGALHAEVPVIAAAAAAAFAAPATPPSPSVSKVQRHAIQLAAPAPATEATAATAATATVPAAASAASAAATAAAVRAGPVGEAKPSAAAARPPTATPQQQQAVTKPETRRASPGAEGRLRRTHKFDRSARSFSSVFGWGDSAEKVPAGVAPIPSAAV